MNEKRTKKLIEGWYYRSRVERDVFSKFIFFWFCFNAWLEHCSSKDSDAAMLKELADKQSNMRDFIETFEVAMKGITGSFRENIRTLASMTQKNPLKDTRGRREPIIIKDERDFENIVWAIYRIRCNLFHGNMHDYQSSENLEDFTLVKVSGMILEDWVGTLVLIPFDISCFTLVDL